MGIFVTGSIRHRATAVQLLIDVLILLLFAASVATPALARALDLDRTVAFHIPRQPIESALIAFSSQAHIQVIIAPNVNSTAAAPSISGTVSVRAALNTILRNTGLTYAAVGESVSVTRTSDRSLSGTGSSAVTASLSNGDVVGAEHRDDQQLPRTLAGNHTAGAERETGKRLEEVVVTAEKREERLQDVPMAMTAVSAQSLTESNQVKITDYYSQVPGLSIASNIESAQNVVIRGVTTGGFTTPTVGITIDDVPFGSSSGLVGNLVPDLDPGDLSRLEVLRGPQGTLYGASSMGGLLKFVTVDPSTDVVSGHVNVGTSTVYNGTELGYSFRGAVNIPLGDTFAVRISGFAREEPGYIDNSILRTDGINEVWSRGGRFSALWKLSETLSLKLSALYQRITGEATDAQTGAGNLERNDLTIPGAGGYLRQVQAYSAIVKYKIGTADLISLSGFNVNSSHNSIDSTNLFAPLTKMFFGVTDTPEFIDNRDSKFTQEIRLSMPIGPRVDWLLGGFYTHERTPFFFSIDAEDPTTLAIVGTSLYGAEPETYSEYAVFTDITLHVTDRFDIQVGGRQSHISQVFGGIGGGPLEKLISGSSFVVTPNAGSASNPNSYLLTPSFKVSRDLMAYARLASGYRAGGPNAGVAPGSGIPLEYQPDKTRDYEIGIKGDALDKSLSYDASIYYIEWKDIQLQLLHTYIANGTKVQGTYVGNASAAKSQGVELSLEWRPIDGLRIAGWAAWNDAVLTENFPEAALLAGTYGASGGRLPFAARFSSNFSADDEFRVMGQVRGFAGISVSYLGGREDIFTATPQRQYLPPYAKTDFQVGVKYQSWTSNLYVNNVTNRRGLISGGFGNIEPQEFYFIQPRTVGLNVSKAF